ncbi:MAG: hypothetical protein LBR06_02025 [Bacteroidales bacterium]|jgi:regulator of replication initiation timing|nr:hypothetical protein [Bacteroidales bacterium]
MKKISLGSTEKERRNNLIVIFLSVILAVLAVLFVLQRREHGQVVQLLNMQKDTLQSQLSQIKQSYDQMQTDNDTLNARLDVARTRVQDLMLEIGQIKKASYAQIAKYQDEVGSLRRIMRNFVTQIDSLNRKNEQLMAENARVKQDIQAAESRNRSLEAERQQLSQRVQQAAKLEALGLTMAAVNGRGKAVSSTDRADKLMVSFTLSKNVTAKRGEKNIYIRILRPDQVLLTKSQDNRFKFEDLNIPYSAMRTVTYEGNELPVNIFWDNEGEPAFMSGTYTVDVFTDGDNIGTASFSFRK